MTNKSSIFLVIPESAEIFQYIYIDCHQADPGYADKPVHGKKGDELRDA
jgi:hypothetical protein